MHDFAVAVKAVIVRGGKVLVIRRRANDSHKPNTWDLPGGRLNHGENPYDGLKREVHEDIGINIDIHAPIDIHHFVRDDGQKITMILFLCTPKTSNIRLSEEHTDYEWRDIHAVDDWITPGSDDWLKAVIEKLLHYELHKKIG